MRDICIDVIIPTFNSMPWLEYAIDSVLDQTHTNIMLYVIDDGSTDRTYEFMKSLRDDRIVYIRKSNGGVSSARNLGILKSKSEYITFLDADDVWSKNKLEDQLSLLEKRAEIGLVYGHHYVIDTEDIILRNNRYYERGDIFDKLLEGNFISGSASMVMIRRSILDKVGGFFNEELENGEDWELWLRIAKISEIDFVPKILASIRSHELNAQTNLIKMSDSLLRVYDIIRNNFVLSYRQQQTLASTCLYQAAVQYRKAGNYKSARKALFRLFRYNPSSYRALSNWKIAIVPGEFMKIIFASKAAESLKQSIKKMIRLIKRSIRKILS